MPDPRASRGRDLVRLHCVDAARREELSGGCDQALACLRAAA